MREAMDGSEEPKGSATVRSACLASVERDERLRLVLGARAPE
jgi:hypothetical protein